MVGDVPALRDVYHHDVETSPATFDIAPVSVAERLAWFHHHAETGPHRLLVAEQDGRLRGFASSHQFAEQAAYRSSVRLSVYVHPGALGQGIGTRLDTALFDALAGEKLHRAYAGITLPNPASVALHLSVVKLERARRPLPPVLAAIVPDLPSTGADLDRLSREILRSYGPHNIPPPYDALPRSVLD